MTHRYRKYADWAGITRSLTETRPTRPHRLLTAGVDLKTIGGRFGHAEAFITLKFYAQFARPPIHRFQALLISSLPASWHG
jgi:hypothetical protein